MDNIALFDMDGTLVDFDKGMYEALLPLYSPDEEVLEPPFWDSPEHIRSRIDMIMERDVWWRNLEPIKLGMDFLKEAQKIGYEVHILTQGPHSIGVAWKEKVDWVRTHLGDVDITVTRNKGLVYGKILVDDYPPYLDKWLKWRNRGLCIIPHNEHNKDYEHEQTLRLSGDTFWDCVEAIEDKFKKDND